MKLNLSIDEKDFKNQVKNLRKKLNTCMTNGILDEDFEEQLHKLSQIEEALLSNLIPYYRVYVDNIKQTSMQINPIKQLGAYNFDSLLQTILRINENLFITSGIDGKVQFFNLTIANDSSDYNQIKSEWSAPIKEITEGISFIYKLNINEILLFGVRGGCYLLTSDNFDKAPDINEKIKVSKIQTDYELNGFGRCLGINDNLFLAENENEKIYLFEIVKEDKYCLIFHKDIFCSIPNWTALEKISDDYFVVGTMSGDLCFVKYENKQLTITNKMNLLNDEVRAIRLLENGDGNINSLIVIGNEGQFKILHFNEDKKITKIKMNVLKGNLFDVQSKKGTAIVLSEDGIIYLFEENFGEWYLNEDATLREIFFTNVFKFDISKYLIMDIEGKLNLLHIDRIDTPEDLQDLPLYTRRDDNV